MKTFKEFINEKISKQELNDIEKFADKLFAKLNIDVNFTKHFYDRLNDTRNKPEIKVNEVIRLFRELYKQKKKEFEKINVGDQKVVNDLVTDINLPFVIQIDRKNNEMDFIAKTVMRKKDFKTSNPKVIIR